MSNLETFKDLDTIREHIFGADEVSCYTVWGGADAGQEKGRAERLADAWMAKWMSEKKDDSVYCLELDMSVYEEKDDVELTNWIIWFDIVKRLSDMIKVEDMDISEYKKSKINSIYEYFTEEMSPEDMDEDDSVDAQVYVRRLFECYTKDLGIHIRLIFRRFECCCELFPKEKDTNFFRTLFVLSPKGRPVTLNLAILLCSSVPVSDIVHHDQDISSVESAYPDGVEGGGNLTRYEAAAFESYLK